MPELSSLYAPIVAAVVTSLVVAAIVGFFQGRSAARREIARRQSDISVEMTKLLIEGGNTKAVAKRFAVGLVKILNGPLESELGAVCFIPINSRITVGREPDNDLVLTAANVSRLQCGFYSEGRDIFLEDYRSASGTFVNDKQVASGNSRRLKGGDKIAVSDYEIEFQYVHRSKVLPR
jgi:hypothetical protein